MITPTSGSNEILEGKVIGTFNFYDEGGVTVWMPEPDGFEDDVYESFKMTTGFLFHALTRPDWLTEYFLLHHEKDLKVNESKPLLTLIKGGKDD